MSENNLPTSDDLKKQALLQQNLILNYELQKIEKEIFVFEGLLRLHLSDLIVEAQELFILYKQIKKAKKIKRSEQKRRGKNYKEPKGIKPIIENEEKSPITDDQKEKKRLYREAMLFVHPDKFSMNEEQSDIATKITTQLIDIYKTGTLKELEVFHAHIFNENRGDILNQKVTIKKLSGNIYLEQEIIRLEKEIALLKKSQIYKVVTEYKDPLIFISELKDYYIDRIFKLKKRTRKGL